MKIFNPKPVGKHNLTFEHIDKFQKDLDTLQLNISLNKKLSNKHQKLQQTNLVRQAQTKRQIKKQFNSNINIDQSRLFLNDIITNRSIINSFVSSQQCAFKKQQRYVSQFQVKIKQILSRIPYCKQQQKHKANQNNQILPKIYTQQSSFDKSIIKNNKSLKQKTQIINSHDYSLPRTNKSLMKSTDLNKAKIVFRELRNNHCKTQTKNKQSSQEILQQHTIQQQNKQLVQKYKLYQNRFKKGNKKYLKLMSKATIERADFYLNLIN